MNRFFLYLMLAVLSLLVQGCSRKNTSDLREVVIERYTGGEKKVLAIYNGEGVEEILVERRTYDLKGKMIFKENLVTNQKFNYADIYPEVKESVGLKKYLNGGWKTGTYYKSYIKENIVTSDKKEIIDYLDNTRICIHPKVVMASYSNLKENPFKGYYIPSSNSPPCYNLDLINDDEFHIDNRVYKRDSTINDDFADRVEMSTVIAGGVAEVIETYKVDSGYAISLGVKGKATEILCVDWNDFMSEKYGEFPYYKGDKIKIRTTSLVKTHSRTNCVPDISLEYPETPVIVFGIGLPEKVLSTQ